MYPVPETKNPAGAPSRTLMSREYDPMVSEAEVIETGVIPIPQSQIPAPIPNFPAK
jgi:hypothetical protein